MPVQSLMPAINRLALSFLSKPSISEGRLLLEACQSIYSELPVESVSIAKRTIKTIPTSFYQDTSNPVSVRFQWLELWNDALQFLAHDDFDSYLLYLEKDRSPESRFYMPRRAVLYPLVKDLEDLHNGKLRFLSISLPPRTGKSTLCIFYETWIAGRFPNENILNIGYSDTLVRGFMSEAISIMTDTKYNWASVFPDLQIITHMEERSIDLGVSRRFSTISYRGIDGSITGGVQASSLLCFDDLVRDQTEALNRDRLDSLTAKVATVAGQRPTPTKAFPVCPQLHVATRWSLHDPIGRMQSAYSHRPDYKFVAIPALNEDKESNFKYTHIPMTKEYFESIKAQPGMDDISFSCIYQQEPIERSMVLFDKKELLRYDRLPENTKPDYVIAVADTKTTGTDFFSAPIAYVYNSNSNEPEVYIEDVLYSSSKYDSLIPILAAKLSQHGASKVVVESNAAGVVIARQIEDALKLHRSPCQVITKHTVANKNTRIESNYSYIVRLFHFKLNPQSMYKSFLKDLCNYSMMSKNQHDDAPDSLSMLVDAVLSRRLATLSILDRKMFGF